MKPKAEAHLQELALFVHGVLFSFHLLGVVYNLKRRNRLDVLAHSFAAGYDLHAAIMHVHKLKELKGELS